MPIFVECIVWQKQTVGFLIISLPVRLFPSPPPPHSPHSIHLIFYRGNMPAQSKLKSSRPKGPHDSSPPEIMDSRTRPAERRARTEKQKENGKFVFNIFQDDII